MLLLVVAVGAVEIVVLVASIFEPGRHAGEACRVSLRYDVLAVAASIEGACLGEVRGGVVSVVAVIMVVAVAVVEGFVESCCC